MSAPDEPDVAQRRTVVVLAVVAVLIVTLAAVHRQRTSADDDAPASRAGATPAPTPRVPGPAPQAILPAPAPSSPGRGPDQCVRFDGTKGLAVTTFNIHSGLADGRLRLDDLAQAVESWDSGLVLLQEVSRNRGRVRNVDEPAALEAGLGMHAAFGVNDHPADGGDYGVMTLSRYPIVSSRNTLLPTAPGAQQRGLLRTVVDFGGTRIAVYNTHLQDGYFPLRLRQMRAITRILAREDLPVILGGDLNTVPGSPVIGMTRPLLSDSFAEVGKGEGATIPAFRPRIRIDYLLHSPRLVPLESRVMPLTASDHRAVRSVFRLPDDIRVCVPAVALHAAGR
ncbi:endonuclease/exonuclease/phosphatase family protein [Nocardioides sp. MAHUQ-72]|uniref:endonuclease/exonuclease/phosphatase family protein n=1 Tax=unclassified Nocardioides TaxID=2615069 RepID=UPI0036153B9E